MFSGVFMFCIIIVIFGHKNNWCLKWSLKQSTATLTFRPVRISSRSRVRLPFLSSDANRSTRRKPIILPISIRIKAGFSCNKFFSRSGLFDLTCPITWPWVTRRALPWRWTSLMSARQFRSTCWICATKKVNPFKQSFMSSVKNRLPVICKFDNVWFHTGHQ